MNIRKKWPNSIEGWLSSDFCARICNAASLKPKNLQERINSLDTTYTHLIKNLNMGFQTGEMLDFYNYVKMSYDRINMIALWDKHGRNTYVIGEEFSHALKDVETLTWKVKNKEICLEVLFSESLNFTDEDGNFYTSAIIFFDSEFNTLNFIFFTGQSFAKWHIDISSPKIPSENAEIFNFMLNCLTYIQSASPSLERLERPEMPPNLHRRQRDRFTQEHSDKPYFPVHLVSWGWMRPKAYSVDESVVQGHLRWQRCGTELKDVKLIWINEHIRKYDKKEEEI